MTPHSKKLDREQQKSPEQSPRSPRSPPNEELDQVLEQIYSQTLPSDIVMAATGHGKIAGKDLEALLRRSGSPLSLITNSNPTKMAYRSYSKNQQYIAEKQRDQAAAEGAGGPLSPPGKDRFLRSKQKEIKTFFR